MEKKLLTLLLSCFLLGNVYGYGENVNKMHIAIFRGHKGRIPRPAWAKLNGRYL